MVLYQKMIPAILLNYPHIKTGLVKDSLSLIHKIKRFKKSKIKGPVAQLGRALEKL